MLFIENEIEVELNEYRDADHLQNPRGQAMTLAKFRRIAGCDFEGRGRAGPIAESPTTDRVQEHSQHENEKTHLTLVTRTIAALAGKYSNIRPLRFSRSIALIRPVGM